MRVVQWRGLDLMRRRTIIKALALGIARSWSSARKLTWHGLLDLLLALKPICAAEGSCQALCVCRLEARNSLRMVVFPALSSPRIRIRTSFHPNNLLNELQSIPMTERAATDLAMARKKTAKKAALAKKAKTSE